ncbi:MAG: hypothetical protein QM697_10700 [Lachnospiraceae bacterium]
MSVKKEYYIKNTHIIIKDDKVRVDCENSILELIATAAKPALLNRSEGAVTSHDE